MCTLEINTNPLKCIKFYYKTKINNEALVVIQVERWYTRSKVAIMTIISKYICIGLKFKIQHSTLQQLPVLGEDLRLLDQRQIQVVGMVFGDILVESLEGRICFHLRFGLTESRLDEG